MMSNIKASDVDRVVARDFLPEHRADVYARLRQYKINESERESDRVRLAVLKLAAGDVARVSKFIDAAKEDYRDVLGWAEYPGAMANATATNKEKMKIAAADLKQYMDWLRSNG